MGFRTIGPGHFPKSEISKISCSSHSKNAHIKLNGFQWVFGGWGDAPFIFYGPDGPKTQKWTPELFIYLRGAIGYRHRFPVEFQLQLQLNLSDAKL